MCTAYVEFRDSLLVAKPSHIDAASVLVSSAMEGMDPSELAAILDKMEKAGRAYKRLEQHIGPGICFGLGTNKSRSQ